MLPAVGKADEPTRLKGLHERKNLKVGSSLDVGVGGADGVLLDDEDSLAEKVGEDGDAVGLGDEHDVFLDGDCGRDDWTPWSYYFEAKHEKLVYVYAAW